MCGISLGGTARLSQQIKAGLGSNQKEIFDSFPGQLNVLKDLNIFI